MCLNPNWFYHRILYINCRSRNLQGKLMAGWEPPGRSEETGTRASRRGELVVDHSGKVSLRKQKKHKYFAFSVIVSGFKILIHGVSVYHDAHQSAEPSKVEQAPEVALRPAALGALYKWKRVGCLVQDVKQVFAVRMRRFFPRSIEYIGSKKQPTHTSYPGLWKLICFIYCRHFFFATDPI